MNVYDRARFRAASTILRLSNLGKSVHQMNADGDSSLTA